jgi:hypothetical protein
MPFSRGTLFTACSFLGEVIEHHGDIDDMMLRWELDDLAVRNGGIRDRCRRIFLFLRDNSEVEFDGRLIRDLVVETAVRYLRRNHRRAGATEFINSLSRDGYIISEEGELRRALPAVADLPAADDEVHALLRQYNLAIPLGHLDQAIEAHTRSDWAAANGQLRTFSESLFDEIALLLDPVNAPGVPSGQNRRQLLANLNPPFLIDALGEWSNDGKNFVNGLFKRLHPQGNHPGLSDEEDSTFRLSAVLVVARLFLRRLAARK